MEIIWTPKGTTSLRFIKNHIAKDSKTNADNFLVKLLEKVDLLVDQPYIGRIIPEVGDKQIREMIFGNYRMLYFVSDKIHIFRVIHSKMNFNLLDLIVDF